MQKILGSEISKEIIARLKKLPAPKKIMAAVLVGDDPISVNFVNEKKKIAAELGVQFKIYRLSAELNSGELRERVNEIAADKSVGGVIVQLPLPPHIEKHDILRDIPATKDVDVLGDEAISSFYVEEGGLPRRSAANAGVLPPSCGVVEEICKRVKLNLAKSRVAVVGLGLLIGKPIAIYMMHKAKDVMLLASKSDVSEVKNADLVISGVGKAKLILPKMIKNGATVIDFGYDYSGEKLVGDFDHSIDDSDLNKLERIAYYTPTPGGTGPILVACLFQNFYSLNS